MINQNLQTIISLIDKAIEEAEKAQKDAIDQGADWLVEDSELAKDNFVKLKKKAISGDLPPSDGAGMGISRALSEWAPEGLYMAGKAIEDFYRDYWR